MSCRFVMIHAGDKSSNVQPEQRSDEYMAHTQFPIDEMERIAREFDGSFGFYVKDLVTGATHDYNANQRFPTASICKVPVMIELFRRAEEGALSILERRRLTQPLSELGGGVLNIMKNEPEFTLRDYCRLMIAVSDNMAADLLINLLGPENINATMDALGFHNTRTNMTLGEWRIVMRSMKGVEPSRETDPLVLTTPLDPNSLAYTESLDNNVTSASDMGMIFERVFYGQVVSPNASFQMLEMLKSCDQRHKIPRYLKRDVIVAHQTGGSNRVQGDVGVVFLPTGPMIISLLTLANTQSMAGVEAMGQISQLAIKAFSPESVAERIE